MDTNPDLFGLFGALAVTLGAVFLCAMLYKKMVSYRPRGNHTLQVLSSLSLGSREKLILVNAGDKQLLLGVTPQQVTHLCELEISLDEPERVQEFGAVLNGWLKK